MKKVNSVYKYKTGIGRQEVWLTEQDLDLLKKLAMFKSLSLYQLKYYSKYLYGIDPHVTQRKFRKWMLKGLLSATKYTKSPGYKIYYTIGDEGIKVLKELGLYTENYDYDIPAVRRNYDHFFGIRDSVLVTLIKLHKYKRTVDSIPPSSFPYLDKNANVPLIVPDWIIKNESLFLNIEVDTGTEYFAKLHDKFLKYKQYASQNPNEFHHVLIVVIDEADSDLKYINQIPKDRKTRVANVKNLVINLNPQHNKNLSFSVVTMSRVANIACDILTSDTNQIAIDVKVVNRLLELNDTFNYEIYPLNPETFYLHDVDQSVYADGHFVWKDHSGQEKFTVMIKMMKEGSVKDLNQIRYLNHLKDEGRFKRSVNMILAIYGSNSELHNDVKGKVLHHVCFGSIEQLELDLNNTPSIYKTINSVRLEEVTLY